MKDHVKILGIIWIAFGALSLLGALTIYLIFFGVSIIPGVSFGSGGILRLIGGIAGVYLAVLGIPKIIGGIGLLNGQEWGRILIIIVGFLALVNIPVGTAIGIYSLIVLFNRETIEYFNGPKTPQTQDK